MENKRHKFDWFEVEMAMEEELPLCLKKILCANGYDSISSLQELSEKNVDEIEKYMAEFGDSVIKTLDCCHSEKYKSQVVFKFLPGHKSLLSILGSKISNLRENKKSLCQQNFPTILSELVLSEQNNSKKHKNHAVYSNVLKDFATYIYLMGGKCCYETLQANLSLPSTKTIRKGIY